MFVDPPVIRLVPIAPNRPILIACALLAAPIFGFAISSFFPARSKRV